MNKSTNQSHTFHAKQLRSPASVTHSNKHNNKRYRYESASTKVPLSMASMEESFGHFEGRNCVSKAKEREEMNK